MALELIKLNDTTLPAIAAAIREKTGDTALLLPSQMPNAIASIPSGGGGGAKEPYIEETYDSKGELIEAKLVGYTAIRPYLFCSCGKLALNSLPSGLTSIGNSAFNSCTGLTSITFNGKPNSISSSAFNGCANLKTINVPWASGEVANAPWGATNATINYNYTG